MTFFTTSIVSLVLLMAEMLPQMVASQGFLAGAVSRDRIVDQLVSLLGHDRHRERLAGIEASLRPTFMALPKDPRGGGLENRAARYALHRYFLVKYGWHIEGLSLEVQDTRTEPPAHMLKSRMPSFIMSVLADRMASERVTLDELSVLVATIEDLVHSDAVDLLELAYKTHGFSTDEPLDASQAGLTIHTFVLYFLLPTFQDFAHEPSYISDHAMGGGAGRFYPGWGDASLWVKDVTQGLEYQDHSFLRPFVASAGQGLDFTVLGQWATVLIARFGERSEVECKEMQNQLLDFEDVERDNGRVSLGKVYGAYLSGVSEHIWRSPAYLRHLGALDESNPRQPSVIVPNVMYSKANCIPTSGFQAYCCVDACQVLMAGLEEQVSQPAAPPALVAAVVSGMTSDTVAGPRELPAPLRSRLGEIAGVHGGRVPLHSRLFAQWMHYAFPNECPYPRSLLTSEIELSSHEWESKHNVTQNSIKEDIQAVADLLNGDHATAGEDPVQLWSEDEELLSDWAVAPEHSFMASLRWLVCTSALVVGASVIKKTVDSGRGGLLNEGDKHGKTTCFDSARATKESRDHFV